MESRITLGLRPRGDTTFRDRTFSSRYKMVDKGQAENMIDVVPVWLKTGSIEIEIFFVVVGGSMFFIYFKKIQDRFRNLCPFSKISTFFLNSLADDS